MVQRGASKQLRLAFDRDERKYELWEAKMLGHRHLLGLKDTDQREPAPAEEMACGREEKC